MSLCHVIDEFLNQDGLADTSTSEKTDLATTGIRGEEVDNFNTSLKNFGGGGLVNERRGVGMDRAQLDTLDRTTLVNGLPDDVHYSSERGGTNGNENRCTSVDNLLTTDETFCTIHGNGADRVLAQMGRDLKDETASMKVLNLQCIENRRKVVGIKLDINDGTDDGFYGANSTFGFSCICAG